MIIATTILPDSQNADDTITLDETARHRRRIKMVSDKGIEFLLDLPQSRLLRHGEGIQLSDGRIIQVVAEPEALFEVRGRNSQHLMSLAWQLGNRHLPTQILEDHLRIRRDHVIRDMLKGLGATINEISASFDPQGGAYDHHKNNSHTHD